MKKIFIRPLYSLTLRQHIVHALVTFGLPVFVVELFFVDYYNNDFWVADVSIALIVAVFSGIIFGLLEHGFFKGIRKENQNMPKK